MTHLLRKQRVTISWQNPPQIIIGLATNEFADLIKEVEANWGTSGSPSVGLPRPYYVLSHYLATSNDVLNSDARRSTPNLWVHRRPSR